MLPSDLPTEPSSRPEELDDSKPVVTDSVGELEIETRRPKPAEPSLIRRLLPPLLGAFCSFPIALGILWYGFGKDIGNAGPTVARYIPWLVPEHLRGRARWKYDPTKESDTKTKQFDAPKNLDAGEFGRIGGNQQR